MRKTVSLFVMTLFLFMASTRNVLAVDEPNFPLCSNPQGALVVSYNSGVHGIPGDLSEHVGSDKVYSLTSNTLIQCFCSVSGDGIQTNWWMVSSLTDEQKRILQSEGWILIPNGALWGLEEAPYMAKNSNFSCLSGSTGGNESLSQAGAPICNSSVPEAPVLLSVVRNGSEATLTWTKSALADHYVISYGDSPSSFQFGVPDTGNVTTFTIRELNPNKQYYFKVIAVNNCMPSQTSSSGVGGFGQVLGLAATGEEKTIYFAFIVGLGLLGVGLVLHGYNSRSSKNA